MGTVSLIARLSIAAAVAAVFAGCGSPEASQSARVEKVVANVRGIT